MLRSLAFAIALSIGASAGLAQSGWQPNTQSDERSSPSAGGGQSNTTVVPRTAPEPRGSRNIGRVTLAAFLTEDGQRIDHGLVWRLFQPTAAKDTKPKLISTWREPSPEVRVPPGEYVINVAFGRAHLTRKVTVQPGGPVQERFVLNAGGLRVTALLAGGEPAPERTVSYEVYSGETDQLGGRTRVLGGARPGVIVRLNAGIYHIVSTYGDANAVVQADVTVEPGKLTEASISHLGAKVTFKLVTRAGGEAQADAQWSVLTTQGELVKQSAGALPTHILDPGGYIVTARHSGRSFRRAFTVKAGETAQIEVVMQ